MKLICFALAFVSLCIAQDNSAQDRTIPFSVRSDLPGTCKLGQVITRKDLTPGSNVYICGSSNNWVLLGGGGATVPGSPTNSVQFNNTGAFGGDARFLWDATSHTLTLGTPFSGPGGAQLILADDSFAYMQMAVGGHSNTEIDFYESGGTVAAPTTSSDGDAILSLTSVGFNANNLPRVSSEILTFVLGTPSTGGVSGRMQFDVAPATAGTDTGFTQLNLLGNGMSRVGPLNPHLAPGPDLVGNTDSTLTIEDINGTGITTNIIRAGPSQSTNDLTQWQDSSKAVLASVSATGRFRSTLHTPASSSETCIAGQFSADANFYYECVSANTWKRVALNSF